MNLHAHAFASVIRVISRCNNLPPVGFIQRVWNAKSLYQFVNARRVAVVAAEKLRYCRVRRVFRCKNVLQNVPFATQCAVDSEEKKTQRTAPVFGLENERVCFRTVVALCKAGNRARAVEHAHIANVILALSCAFFRCVSRDDKLADRAKILLRPAAFASEVTRIVRSSQRMQTQIGVHTFFIVFSVLMYKRIR